MVNSYRFSLPCLALLLALLTLASPAHAQAPAWDGAAPGSLSQANGTSTTRAVATDAAGNVFVTGSFTGAVAFGTTLLTSLGSNDLFVAKYVPATGTWAWAQSGGGTNIDSGNGLVVRGSSLYVTGYVTNTTANDNGVLFGGTGTTAGTVQVNGATGTISADILLAKYTDNGTSATLDWTQVGGGTGFDSGNGVAMSGSSLYVTGQLTNDTANGSGVLFGGSGTTPGTVQVNGATSTNNIDLVLARYTDNGSSAALDWTQVGGGNSNEAGTGVAVSGTSVYMTGYIFNNTVNANGVLFGGSGTTPGTVQVKGASSTTSPDLVLAKYTDNGTSATLGWTQVGGGINIDGGAGVAVSGAIVYVVGYITNSTTNGSAVRFGGNGTTAGTTQVNGATSTPSQDLLLAKYTDNGPTATLVWNQVGGGTGTDQGNSIVVSGSSVYVTGYIFSVTGSGVVFGGTGTTAGTVPVNGAGAFEDLLLAKYTDNGATATLNWTQVGGGTGTDQGNGLALSGTSVLVGGAVGLSTIFAFNPASVAPLAGTAGNRAVLALADAGTGSWQTLVVPFNGGTSFARAVATDAAGNVFVTGNFMGQVDFGSTRLSSLGLNDLFVAKYVPATGTWAWAQSGGGTGQEFGYGVAVSGTSVYVAGQLTNNTANVRGVLFGGTGTTPGTTQVNGATATSSADLVLAKYTDNGTSATLGWTQVGGGTGADVGTGVAVSGTSVYMTGQLTNSTGNTTGALFGGSGTTPGTVQVNGATSTSSADIVLAKYTDNGLTARLGWTQVGGGTGFDISFGVAVSSSNVYVTGYLINNTANVRGVLFGSTGTTVGTVPQYGATSTSSQDIVLAKYTDNGSTATLGWTQVGGGTGFDVGNGVAVSGSSVYVTGYLINNTANGNGVLFGGAGTTPGTAPQYGATSTSSQDIVLAKYTDNGATATLGWTQVGGGTGQEFGNGVAVSGSSVFVIGTLINNTANGNGVLFGGTGTTAGTVQVNGATSTNNGDLLLAKYTDNGATATLAWTQVGGGPNSDSGQGVAVSGQNVLAVGTAVPTASFGAFTITNPLGGATAVLARLVDTSLPLPVQLTAFSATASGPAIVHLAWATASEKNSRAFDVERSTDGRQFARLGTVAAAGSSSRARAYEWRDAQLPAGAERLYYRLRQADLDGTFSYSPVRVVAGAEGAGLVLFPNPARGAVALAGAAPGTAVQVLDAMGRLVTTATADATGTAALALPAGLAAGVYVVRSGSRALRLAVD